MTITTKRLWFTWDVRKVCVDHELYTCGNNEDYERVFNMVRELDPTVENLYVVAKDISEHSRDASITSIMYMLEKEAVHTTFDIEE